MSGDIDCNMTDVTGNRSLAVMETGDTLSLMELEYEEAVEYHGGQDDEEENEDGECEDSCYDKVTHGAQLKRHDCPTKNYPDADNSREAKHVNNNTEVRDRNISKNVMTPTHRQNAHEAQSVNMIETVSGVKHMAGPKPKPSAKPGATRQTCIKPTVDIKFKGCVETDQHHQLEIDVLDQYSRRDVKPVQGMPAKAQAVKADCKLSPGVEESAHELGRTIENGLDCQPAAKLPGNTTVSKPPVAPKKAHFKGKVHEGQKIPSDLPNGTCSDFNAGDQTLKPCAPSPTRNGDKRLKSKPHSETSLDLNQKLSGEHVDSTYAELQEVFAVLENPENSSICGSCTSDNDENVELNSAYSSENISVSHMNSNDVNDADEEDNSRSSRKPQMRHSKPRRRVTQNWHKSHLKRTTKALEDQIEDNPKGTLSKKQLAKLLQKGSDNLKTLSGYFKNSVGSTKFNTERIRIDGKELRKSIAEPFQQ